MDTESKSAIKNYFSLLDFFTKAAQGSGSFNYGSNTLSSSDKVSSLSSEVESARGLRRQASGILQQLRGAKIFSIPFSVYSEVWDAVDQFISDDAGCKIPESFKTSKLLNANKNINSSEPLDNYVVRIIDHLDMQMSVVSGDEELPYARDAFVEGMLDPLVAYMNQWPDIGRRYPERMPFGLTYLGYGDGIELSSFQLAMRFRNTANVPSPMKTKDRFIEAEDFISYRILGHLLNANGESWEMSSYTIAEPLVLPAKIPKVGGRTMSLSSSNLDSDQFAYLKEGMKSPKYRALLNGVYNQFNDTLVVGGYLPLSGEYSDYTLFATRHEEYGDAWTFGKLVEGFAYYSAHVGPEVVKTQNISSKDPLGYWCNSWSLSPWIVPTLIDLINENNKTFVFKGTYDSSTRKELGKNHKRLVKQRKKRPVLPAYYVIDVKPKIVRATSSDALRNSFSRGRKLTHRHDRDGHERVLVKRGRLPLLDDDRALLESRGYTLYADSQPLNKDRDRLIRRRLPMRNHGEWLAMRVSWVKESVVGDESLPYRPAVRRLSTESIVDLVRGS